MNPYYPYPNTKPTLRLPTDNNPFMNVMPIDYGTQPEYADYPRYNVPDSKNSNKVIDKRIKQSFDKNLIRDADSMLWERLNSQREYISQPVGSVPNNQDEYANWLYGTNGNCKHGSIYARHSFKNTDESMLCNGFNVSAPTNMGLLGKNLMSSVYSGPITDEPSTYSDLSLK